MPVGALWEIVGMCPSLRFAAAAVPTPPFFHLYSSVLREFVTFLVVVVVVFRAFVCSAEINKRQMTAAAAAAGFRQQQQFQYIEVLLLLRSAPFPKQGGRAGIHFRADLGGMCTQRLSI